MTPNSLRILVCTLLCVLAAPAPAASSVENLVQRKAEVLHLLHKKAKKALANAAQDRVFADYFTATDAAERHRLKDHIDHISLSLQGRVHSGEMCLIDATGSEISRIVGNRIAADLAHDEKATSFFAPGFARSPRTVFIAPLYLSADVHKWVVAYATPVTTGGVKRALLHYELSLEIYQSLLNRDLSGPATFLMAIDGSGHVLADSRQRIAVVARADSVTAADYFATFRFGDHDFAGLRQQIDRGGAVTDSRGQRFDAAYAAVEDWTLVAFQAVAGDAS